VVALHSLRFPLSLVCHPLFGATALQFLRSVENFPAERQVEEELILNSGKTLFLHLIAAF